MKLQRVTKSGKGMKPYGLKWNVICFALIMEELMYAF